MLTAKIEFVSVKEAADIIGCSTAHVRRLLIDEQIRGEHISGVWAVDRNSAKEFAKKPQKTGRPRGG